MSEATAVVPRDYPDISEPAKGVNIRRALAGLYLLQGDGPIGRCLVKAGYSRATARATQRNGLNAEACLREAAKLDEGASPAKLLDSARRRAAQALAVMDPATTPLKDVMRALETMEKFHGGHESSANVTVTAVADRLAQLVSLLVAAKQRGLPVPALPASFVDAEVVASVATSDESREMSTHAIDATPDGTTR